MLRSLVVAGTLWVAAYQDFRTREIDDKVWIAGTLLATPLLAAELASGRIVLQLYLLSLAVSLALAVLSLKLGLTGEADAIAFAFLGFFEPPRLSPLFAVPLGTILLLSLVPTAFFAAYNVYWNLGKPQKFEGYRLNTLERLVALVAMRYVSREEYERYSYMLAPATRVDADGLKIEIGVGIPGRAEPPSLPGFWATALAPYVTFIALGYSAYLALCWLL